MQFRSRESEEKYYKSQGAKVIEQIAAFVLSNIKNDPKNHITFLEKKHVKFKILSCLNFFTERTDESYSEMYSVFLITLENLRRFVESRGMIKKGNAILVVFTSLMISHRVYIDVPYNKSEYLYLLNNSLHQPITQDQLNKLEENFLKVIHFNTCTMIFHPGNNQKIDENYSKKETVLKSVIKELQIFKNLFQNPTKVEERKCIDRAIDLVELCLKEARPLKDLISELNSMSLFLYKNPYREKLLEKLKLFDLQQVSPKFKHLVQFFNEMNQYEDIIKELHVETGAFEIELSALQASQNAITDFLLKDKRDEMILATTLKRYQGFFENNFQCHNLQKVVLNEIELKKNL